MRLVQKTRAILDQSDVKLTPIATSSPAFSHALGSLIVFTMSFHWLSGIFFFFLIGRSDYFGFGFTTLKD